MTPFYPIRNNVPLGFESQRLKFLTGFTQSMKYEANFYHPIEISREHDKGISFHLSLQFIKTVPKGGWVCWRTFTAAPLNVLLPSFRAYYRSHLR